MLVDKTCAEAQRLLVAVVAAATEVDAKLRLYDNVLCLHVQRSAKGS